MSWFRRRSAPAAAAEEAAPAAPEVHHSLAMADLLGQLHPDRRLHVLDLGPAIGSNVEFWTDRWLCSVEVADAYPALAAAGDDAEAAARVALPHDPAARPADVILAWDLFNYLDRGRLRAVGARLAGRTRPGAILFAMLWTGKEIPLEPGRFTIRDGGDLVYGVDAAHTRPGPRYRPAEIAAMTAGFSTDRNYLLRHGVQEYLLVRDAELAEGGGGEQ
jgi:hypothetical protein